MLVCLFLTKDKEALSSFFLIGTGLHTCIDSYKCSQLSFKFMLTDDFHLLLSSPVLFSWYFFLMSDCQPANVFLKILKAV